MILFIYLIIYIFEVMKQISNINEQQGAPQTEINGQIIVGFDKTRINSLLGLN